MKLLKQLTIISLLAYSSPNSAQNPPPPDVPPTPAPGTDPGEPDKVPAPVIPEFPMDGFYSCPSGGDPKNPPAPTAQRIVVHGVPRGECPMHFNAQQEVIDQAQRQKTICFEQTGSYTTWGDFHDRLEQCDSQDICTCSATHITWCCP